MTMHDFQGNALDLLVGTPTLGAFSYYTVREPRSHGKPCAGALVRSQQKSQLTASIQHQTHERVSL